MTNRRCKCFYHLWLALLQTKLRQSWTSESVLANTAALLIPAGPLMVSPTGSTPIHRGLTSTMVSPNNEDKKAAYGSALQFSLSWGYRKFLCRQTIGKLSHMLTEFVVIHNGIITNYKDLKAFLVSDRIMDCSKTLSCHTDSSRFLVILGITY